MTRDILNSHRTAIGRTRVSAPVHHLLSKNLISGNVLDYGCGRGFDADFYGWDAFDPYWRPGTILHPNTYNTIVCSYVINVLRKKSEAVILGVIRSLLTKTGVAYITVRRNVKKAGYTSKGTYQRNVILDLPIVTENSDYCIYELRR